MGDKSPKNNKKQATQKDVKTNNDNQKKKDQMAAKQAPVAGKKK
jgi:hypothetical protein